MRAQTRMLMQALPKLADLYLKYDEQTANWSIMEFRVPPDRVVLADMRPIKDIICEGLPQNCYPYRTTALRQSALFAQSVDQDTTETDHMGVWKFRRGGEIRYCTVVPWTEKTPLHVSTATNAWPPQPSTQSPIKPVVPSSPPTAPVQQPSNFPATAVTNQGKTYGTEARTPVEYAGMRFRSQSEVRIAQALDKAKVMYFANCIARMSQGESRVNREPDFLICHEGKWGILEVDGEPFHPPTRKTHEDERDRLFKRYGVRCIEHFDANRCYQEPERIVIEFLELLQRNG